jgi:hypothetical protein
MANNQKKTTTKKSTNNKSTVATTKIEETKVATEPVQKLMRKEIDFNTLIPCRSVVIGGLTYISPKSQMMARWENYGDIEYIPFSELITMNAGAKRFLYDPWIIIEDEDAVKHFSLDKVYS